MESSENRHGAESLFLQALKAALENRTVHLDRAVSGEQWAQVFAMARAHQVLPMILQAVYGSEAAQSIPPQLAQLCRQQTRKLVMLQTVKTAGFLPVLEALRQAGVQPLVVKGLVCRNLYPYPDQRLSSDEDLLVMPEQMGLCHRILTELGFVTENALTDFEVTYTQSNGPVYLEVHQSLFPPESGAYGGLNRFFADAHARSVLLEDIPTLEYTDHLFYLICHSFKHFLHAGFGLRQVCDVVLFANRYGGQVDWQRLYGNCVRIRAEKFAGALFRIGQKHLTFDWQQAHYPPVWQRISVEEGPMLADLLDSGVYGSADQNRLHSSNMTLSAVEAQNWGRTGNRGLLKSLFPDAKSLQGRYPYLKAHPALLPVAWGSRILSYGREALRSGSDAAESVRIGSERIELLKQYGIIDE